jgi:hypothetical protein
VRSRIVDCAHGPLGTFVSHLNLSQNSNLRSIRFQEIILGNSISPLELVTDILLQIVSEMEEITFTFVCEKVEQLELFDWSTCAELFTRKQFLSLRKIQVLVRFLWRNKTVRESTQEAKDWMRQRLPEWDARGLVQVDARYWFHDKFEN